MIWPNVLALAVCLFTAAIVPFDFMSGACLFAAGANLGIVVMNLAHRSQT